ncbi:hypothetical protein HYR54_06070 [Candidatus Acetothermia bacterium]|nr:hypothetical protein [Candidatus Acetothermia bacterium]
MSLDFSEFPQLQNAQWKVASEESHYYNCVAYAAGETHRWWWPTRAYWPDGIRRQTTVESFIQAFRTLRYIPCENASLEEGYEKVAIYARNNGMPTHMARQLGSGIWASKLGKNVDIEHSTLQALEGPAYGNVVKILKRSKQ